MKLVIDGVAIEVRDGVVFVNTGGPVSVNGTAPTYISDTVEPELKWGDVARQVRKLKAKPVGTTVEVIAHTRTTITQCANRLGFKVKTYPTSDQFKFMVTRVAKR